MHPNHPELKEIVSLLRSYGRRLLGGIDPNNLTWIPAGTKGKSILNYFAHILNAEIYWLKHMGDESFNYIEKEATFKEGLQIYDKLENYIKEKIDKSTEADLALHTPIFEGKNVVAVGSLGWMIWRTSMHALHHFAQIAYIRFALDNPPDTSKENSWSTIMDELVSIAHQVKTSDSFKK